MTDIPMLPAETITIQRGGVTEVIERKARPVARTKFQQAICRALLDGRAVSGWEDEFRPLRPQSASLSAGTISNLIRNLGEVGYRVVFDRKEGEFGAYKVEGRP